MNRKMDRWIDMVRYTYKQVGGKIEKVTREYFEF